MTSPFERSINLSRTASSVETSAISPLSQATCRRIEGVPGPEDMVIDHERGVAYVSSQQRKSGSARQVNGDIFKLDLTNDEPQPVNVTGALAEEIGFFHPHGLDLFVCAEGKRRLFVINHRSEKSHSIEVFDVEEKCLKHIGQVIDDEVLTSPNDLVALSEDRFLIVNDHGYRNKVAKIFEDLLRQFKIRLGTVVQGMITESGTTFTRVADGIGLGVGIEVDSRASPKRLFVSSGSDKKILIFRRDGNAWAHDTDINVAGGPDNLTWDKRGRLWVAVHPDLVALFFHLMGWRQTSPSLVLQINEPDTPDCVIERIFSDDGGLLSAASVAAFYLGAKCSRLLIGSVTGPHLLLFDLPAVSA